jgi:hypothetical protein
MERFPVVAALGKRNPSNILMVDPKDQQFITRVLALAAPCLQGFLASFVCTATSARPRALVAGGDTAATSTGQSRRVGGRTRRKTKAFTVSHPVKNRGNKSQGIGVTLQDVERIDPKTVAAAAAATAAATAAANAASAAAAASKKLEGSVKQLLNDKAGSDHQQEALLKLELKLKEDHHSEMLKEKDSRLADQKESTGNLMKLLRDNQQHNVDMVIALTQGKKRKRSEDSSNSSDS